MNDNKQIKYHELVLKRKNFCFTDLKNPSEIESGKYDQKEALGPWSLWQGNLNAKIVVIGQDWGDVKYYLDNHGVDSDTNSTNENLMQLFQVLGIDLGTPSNPNESAPVFLTNAILGIKDNGMASKVKASWEKESTENFLKPLLEIIDPEIIVTLGAVAFNSITRVYGLKKQSLCSMQAQNPICIENKKVFALYHCGQLGIANRKLDLQKEDWKQIKKFI